LRKGRTRIFDRADRSYRLLVREEHMGGAGPVRGGYWTREEEAVAELGAEAAAVEDFGGEGHGAW
jgi:hypothetical protein